MMRKFFWLGLIALAFSIPVLQQRSMIPRLDGPGTGPNAQGSFSGPVASDFSGAGGAAAPGVPSSNASFAPANRGAGPLSPPVYHAFLHPGEYLNFSITPEWVAQRWGQVSASSSEDDLTALRVPLVSGPLPADLHGSLTYHFDAARQLQRITFRGWTGDGSVIIQFLTSQAGFTQRDSSAAGLYKKTSWGKLQGFLRLDLPPAIEPATGTEKFMVLMEWTNPAGSLLVSRQNQAILEAMEEQGDLNSGRRRNLR